MRNLPHENIFIKISGFSESVQGMALRHNLKKALENTSDINAFKKHFTQRADKQNFNNATMQIAKEILEEVDNLKQEILQDLDKNRIESTNAIVPQMQKMPQVIETIEAEIVEAPLMQEFQKLITYAKGKNPRLEYFSKTAQQNALQTLLRIEHKKGNFTQLSTNDIIELLNHNTASSLQRSATTQEIPNATKNATQKAETSDIIFTDKNGKEHTLTKEVQEQWLDTFNLKSLDEAYIPNFSPEVKQALDSVLNGKDIKLTSGSLVKLVQRDRLEFLPYIKESLENSDVIIRDENNALIFAKDIGRKSYFTSVSKNDNGEWVISTNSYKTINQLKNRVANNGEILYLSKEAPNILAEAFTTKAFSNELDNTIIPQPTKEAQDIILQNFRQEFNLKDEAFRPIGYIRDKEGKKEILDSNNTYRTIYNPNTYEKDGYVIISVG